MVFQCRKKWNTIFVVENVKMALFTLFFQILKHIITYMLSLLVLTNWSRTLIKFTYLILRLHFCSFDLRRKGDPVNNLTAFLHRKAFLSQKSSLHHDTEVSSLLGKILIFFAFIIML